jgi:hypothetical protein
MDIPGKLKTKPALIGFGVLALVIIAIALPKGNHRKLDTPADALVGHWKKEGADIHLCYTSTGTMIAYDGTTGDFTQKPYQIDEQNFKDFSARQEGSVVSSKLQIFDKGQKLNIWVLLNGEIFSEKPTTTWIYADGDTEKCGRK